MARIRHRNKRARGTVGANASPGDPTDFNVTNSPWNEEFEDGKSVSSFIDDIALDTTQTVQNLPLTINNDGQADGNNTLIWAIDEEINFGFSQAVYRFNEQFDGAFDGDFGGSDAQIPVQLGGSIKVAVIVIEDAGSPPPIAGTANADTLTGTDGNDAIYGGSLQAGGGVDSIVSVGTGDDILNGLGGDDSLYGWDGNDRFNGGAGTDYLLTGSGADRVEFYDPAVDGVDLLPDFDPASDTINIYVGALQATASAYKTAGLVPNAPITADQFRVGTAALDASDRFIYDTTTGDLFFDSDGSGVNAAVQIANLTEAPLLTNTNIVTFADPVVVGPPNPPTPSTPTPSNTGTPGNDRIIGTAAKDKLLGLGGNDVLSGGLGNDLLDGGTGNNVLVGGKGRDIFALRRGAGRSVVKDFQDRQDKLGLLPNVRFDKLKILQKGRNTHISFGQDLLAILQNVQSDRITRTDFLAIASSSQPLP